jgi:ribonuclease VapC
MSAVTALELYMVVEARIGKRGVEKLETLLSDLHVSIVPFNAAQAKRALAAWRDYGNGHHSAALNLGDVCSYALAADRGQPILFKGDDFARTDCL